MAATGGGGYGSKRPNAMQRKRKQLGANFGQKKRGKPTAPSAGFQGRVEQERRLGDDQAKSIADARKDRYNPRNPVKGGQLKKPTMPTYKKKPPTKGEGGWDADQMKKKLTKTMRRGGKLASDGLETSKDFYGDKFKDFVESRKGKKRKKKGDSGPVKVAKKLKKRKEDYEKMGW